MTKRDETTLSGNQRQKRGGRFLPALFHILGTLMLIAVIAAMVPVTVPRLRGYEVFHVVSPSMTPEIPMGSIVYVKEIRPDLVPEGDVIAFTSQGTVVIHRVVRNNNGENEFVTKGDANEAEDVSPVPYSALIGRVEKHYPYLGALMTIYTDNGMKILLLIVAACGGMLNILAGRLRG